MSEIYLGTSGYCFVDWSGSFYPPGLAKSDWFEYYAYFFNSVEINASYYRIPSEKLFIAIDKHSKDNFACTVKVHADVTHNQKNPDKSIELLKRVTLPISESGKLHGFLAQFPYSFKNSDRNRTWLAELKQYCGSIPVFVEFRHNSWNNDSVMNFLDDTQLLYTCVDEPQIGKMLPPQDVATGDSGYVRFHGRNEKTWWDSSKGDRYDYLYSENELNSWVDRIKDIRSRTKKCYIFFNNCHAGQAVRNAKLMAEMLRNQLNINVLTNDFPPEPFL